MSASKFVLYHKVPATASLKGVLDDAVYDNLFQLEATTSDALSDANDELKKLDGLSEDVIKDAENSVQNVTNEFSSNVDAFFAKKESEIMTV